MEKLTLLWTFVCKYIKYNLVGGAIFLLATVLFFYLNSSIGVTWAWFVSNFLAGGMTGFLVQLFFVYNDSDAKRLRKHA
jgi:inner membrane protein involved in colicin E2 resistance